MSEEVSPGTLSLIQEAEEAELELAKERSKNDAADSELKGVMEEIENLELMEAMNKSLESEGTSIAEDLVLSRADPVIKTFVSDRILDVAASGRSHLDPSFTYGAHTLTVPSLLQAEGSPFEGLVDTEALKHLHLNGIINPGNTSVVFAGLRPFDLVPLKCIGDGNCLLNSISMALWGINDRVRPDRPAPLNELGPLRYLLKNFMEIKSQIPHDWAFFEHQYRLFNDHGVAPVALRPQEASLNQEHSDQSHIFALANIIRRPIIVFSLMRLNNPAYGDLPVNMAGIYLPFFWPPEETDRTPIFVAYLGGNDLSLSGSTAAAQSGSLHFVPLVCQRRQDSPATRVRLQCQGLPLPVLFPSPNMTETQTDGLLRRYLSIYVGHDGFLSTDVPDPWAIPARGFDIIPARNFVHKVAERAATAS